MKSWFKYFIIAGLFLVIIFSTYFYYSLSPVLGKTGGEKLLISSGTSFNGIAELLKEKKIIRSLGAFKFYNLLTGSAHQLKPGTYSLDASLSIPEIVKLLVRGPEDLEILITEGKTLKDIDIDLSSKGLIASGELTTFPISTLEAEYDFLGNRKTLEGFLFPDTYRIAPGSTVVLIVKKVLDNFGAKALPALINRQIQNDASAWYDDLIIASLIEKEIPLKEDRRLVAGILRKRLSLGMPLQVDATVVYAKCGGGFDNCGALTKSDFGIKSPYNTYYYKGLPPAPIANPGLDAVAAAVNPQDSQFLYYLSDPATGKTIFAKTLREHNINKARYLSH